MDLAPTAELPGNELKEIPVRLQVWLLQHAGTIGPRHQHHVAARRQRLVQAAIPSKAHHVDVGRSVPGLRPTPNPVWASKAA